MYDFDKVLERTNTNSLKNDLITLFNPKASQNCISMTIADMDFACADFILDAMRLRLDKQVLGYTNLDDEYYDSIINWYKTRYSYELRRESIFISYGVVYAIDALVEIMTKPKENVMIFTPSYSPFRDSVKKADERNLLCVPLKINNGKYFIDFDMLTQYAQQDETTLLILCSPHNPTGRIWTDSELEKIASICFDNGVRIISDEIHSDILRMDESFTTFGKITDSDKRCVICSAPSKTFNLAGNWMGNVFIFDKDIIQEYKSRYYLLPNPLSMEATKAAYTKGAQWLCELRKYLDESFEIIERFISSDMPLIVFEKPQATYLAWLYVSSYIKDNQNAEDMLAEGGVLVEGEAHFVGNASGYIRLNCAMPHSRLKEALERIKCVLVK